MSDTGVGYHIRRQPTSGIQHKKGRRPGACYGEQENRLCCCLCGRVERPLVVARSRGWVDQPGGQNDKGQTRTQLFPAQLSLLLSQDPQIQPALSGKQPAICHHQLHIFILFYFFLSFFLSSSQVTALLGQCLMSVHPSLLSFDDP